MRITRSRIRVRNDLALLAALLLVAVSLASRASSVPQDYTDADSVLASIDTMGATCGATDTERCQTACETSRRLAASHLQRSTVRPVAVENVWKQCHAAWLASTVAEADEIRLRDYPINGLVLGGRLSDHQARLTQLEARGWAAALGGEHTVRLIFNGQPEAGAVRPEPVRYFNATIDDQNFTQIEATGDGAIWRIRHVERGAPDVEARRAALIKQFGEPYRDDGHVLRWGCVTSNVQACVVVEIMPHQVEFLAIDEPIRDRWGREYDRSVH